MKWITATDLSTWATRNTAKAQLPELVADLIRATSTNIHAFRFLGGEKSQVRGFDGILEAEGNSPFIPNGKSIWEFGTGAGSAKVTEDYEKRTKNEPADLKSQHTLVLVTPHTWDHPREHLSSWLDDRRKTNNWKDIRVIDGQQLEHWLDDCPAVAADYARNVLKLAPQKGVKSIDEFWDEYASGFSPVLKEEVLLAGRNVQADNLLSGLAGNPDRIFISADSPDEVIAFAAAAVRKAGDSEKHFLLSRILVVESVEAARFLMNKSNLVFITSGEGAEKAGMLANVGPTLFPLGADRINQRATRLPRPTYDELAKAFATMGVEPTQAYARARECGRSLAVLRRRYPGSSTQNPGWIESATQLIPAVLAGGWDEGSIVDKKVLEDIALPSTYGSLTQLLKGFLKSQDPPFDQVSSVWSARAPVDAFVHTAHLIDKETLEKLELAAKEVFSEQLDQPKADDFFSVTRSDNAKFSRWLRDGLATTLLLIAALGDEADLQIPGSTPQKFVDRIVRGLAGLNEDPRVIMSLKEQLPLLAEASPDPLLDALEHLLKGKQINIQAIFSDDEEMFAPRSPHTDLLWALETLAWSPVYLARVAKILFELSSIDPGGKTMNRPINSLRTIFLSWSPNTHANLELRLSILSSIIKSQDSIGWELLTKLLPRNHDSSSPTPKPKFKEFGASDATKLTYRDVWKSSSFIVNLALEHAGRDAQRWCEIVKSLSNFEKGDRMNAIRKIETYLDSAEADSVFVVWEKLQDEVHRHRASSNSDWAMKADDIHEMASIVEKYQPADLTNRHKWLFDDWSPDLPNKYDADINVIDQARQSALIEVFQSGGVATVLQLAAKVKFPAFVAEGTVETIADASILFDLIQESYGQSNQLNSFALNISQFGRRKFGEKWVHMFLERALSVKWPDSQIAYLLLGWPDERPTWEFAAKFGVNTEAEYWKNKLAFPLKLEKADVEFAVEKYLLYDSAVKAVCAMYHTAGELSPELILKALDSSVPEINSNPQLFNNLASHYFEEVFDIVAGRSDFSKIDIARREYAYLPLLKHRDKSLTIHALMADDPEFFVQILSDVYRADNANDDAEKIPTTEQRNRASAGYEILSSFKLIPGDVEGEANFSKLSSWVISARKLSAEHGRSLVGDISIGHVLAHSRPELATDSWPSIKICRLLQDLEAPDIERGIQNERFNMRGVYSKAVHEGGEQERELADKYRKWAVQKAAWPRVASMLIRIAEHWDDYAIDADLRAEQQKLLY